LNGVPKQLYEWWTRFTALTDEDLPRARVVGSGAALFCVIFAVASSLFIAAQAQAQAWLVLGGFIAAGTLLYVIAARQKPEYPLEVA